MNIKKILLISLGSICVIVGIIGIFLPGLPTTGFLLIASWAFYKSSHRLHERLLNHKILGKYIADYEQHKSMTITTKLYALTSMWLCITLSSIFVLYPQFGWLSATIMFGLGFIGSVCICAVPTRHKIAHTTY